MNRDVYDAGYVRRQLNTFLEQNRGTAGDGGGMTVGDYLKLWLASLMGQLEPTTVSWYRSAVNRHIVPSLGRVKLSKLDAITIEDTGFDVRALRSIHARLELIEEATPSKSPIEKRIGAKVFLVRGQNQTLRETVARFLERSKVSAIPTQPRC